MLSSGYAGSTDRSRATISEELRQGTWIFSCDNRCNRPSTCAVQRGERRATFPEASRPISFQRALPAGYVLDPFCNEERIQRRFSTQYGGFAHVVVMGCAAPQISSGN